MAKFKILVLTLLFKSCIASDLSKSFFAVGSGLSWLNFRSVDTMTSKADPKLVRKSIFNIKSLYGGALDLVGRLYIRDYFQPYFSFFYYSLQRGNGCLKTFDEKNKEVVNTVEEINFKPSEKGKVVSIANESILLKKYIHDKRIELLLHVGYFQLRSNFKATWPEDSSTSKSKWYGFVGGFKFYYYLTEKTLLLFIDYVYPARYNVIATRDSLLGADEGTASFIFLANSFSVSVFYEIYDSINIGGLLNWSYETKVGKEKIELLDRDALLFENPKTLVFTTNAINLIFYLVWAF